MKSHSFFMVLGSAALLYGCSSPPLTVQSPKERNQKSTTVYVVRHAEKESEPRRDPPLSIEGMQRAEGLAWIMDEVPLAAIYASRRLRTLQTVAPTARLKGLDVRAVSHKNAVALARRVLQRHRNQHVLIASHSESIPHILTGLGVDEAPKVTTYGDLFVVTVPDEEGEATLDKRRFDPVNNAARLTSLPPVTTP